MNTIFQTSDKIYFVDFFGWKPLKSVRTDGKNDQRIFILAAGLPSGGNGVIFRYDFIYSRDYPGFIRSHLSAASRQSGKKIKDKSKKEKVQKENPPY